MNYTTSISLIIGYIIILCLSVITIIHIIRYRKKYGTELIAFLIAATVITGGIIFSTLFVFSVTFFISYEINVLFWKLSLVSGIISLVISSFIYSFFNEYKKIKPFPFLYYTLLLGMLIGALLTPDSIELILSIPPPSSFSVIDPALINFRFNFITGAIIILFQSLITSYYLYIASKINIRTKKKEESLPLILNTIIFTIPILMNIYYVILQQTIFRELSITLIWITSFAVNIMLIKKPEMFFVLPNRIYSINIYHKSGILLYSFNFDKKSDKKDESPIWGNILIGLNHILSEFIGKKDKIDVIQTKNNEIVVRYEIDYGYALVVITNKKNSIIEDLMLNFSIEFTRKYEDELTDLQDINRLINVSEFSGAKEMVEKNFQLYL
ncbi:hypothetical protein ES703_59238 [subsurface metagenome]